MFFNAKRVIVTAGACVITIGSLLISCKDEEKVLEPTLYGSSMDNLFRQSAIKTDNPFIAEGEKHERFMNELFEQKGEAIDRAVTTQEKEQIVIDFCLSQSEFQTSDFKKFLENAKNGDELLTDEPLEKNYTEWIDKSTVLDVEKAFMKETIAGVKQVLVVDNAGFDATINYLNYVEEKAMEDDYLKESKPVLGGLAVAKYSLAYIEKVGGGDISQRKFWRWLRDVIGYMIGGCEMAECLSGAAIAVGGGNDNSLQEVKYNVSTQMLQFKSIEHFISIIDQLTEKIGKNTQSFVDVLKSNGVSEELIDQVAYDKGFNAYEPLEKFEKQFNGFQSLRSAIEPMYQEWQAQEEANPEDNPYAKAGVNLLWATLLNAKKQIMIDGKPITVTVSQSNVRVAANDCRDGQRWQIFNDGPKRKIETSVTILNLGSSHIASGWIAAYWRITKNGRWLPSTTNVYVRPYGSVSGKDCDIIAGANNREVRGWFMTSNSLQYPYEIYSKNQSFCGDFSAWGIRGQLCL